MKYVYSRIRAFYAIRRNVLHMGKVHFIFSIFFSEKGSQSENLFSPSLNILGVNFLY